MSTENPENGYRVNNPGRNRFTDMPFSRIFDKDGNDVTRERMMPKTLTECSDCGIPIRVITEDLENGTAILKCKICQKGRVTKEKGSNVNPAGYHVRHHSRGFCSLHRTVPGQTQRRKPPFVPQPQRHENTTRLGVRINGGHHWPGCSGKSDVHQPG